MTVTKKGGSGLNESKSLTQTWSETYPETSLQGQPPAISAPNPIFKICPQPYYQLLTDIYTIFCKSYQDDAEALIADTAYLALLLWHFCHFSRSWNSVRLCCDMLSLSQLWTRAGACLHYKSLFSTVQEWQLPPTFTIYTPTGIGTIWKNDSKSRCQSFSDAELRYDDLIESHFWSSDAGLSATVAEKAGNIASMFISVSALINLYTLSSDAKVHNFLWSQSRTSACFSSL